jgi:hypothetical protein
MNAQSFNNTHDNRFNRADQNNTSLFSRYLNIKAKYYHLIGIITYIACIYFSFLVLRKTLLNSNIDFSSPSINMTGKPERNLNDVLNTQLNHFVNDIPLIEAFLLENNRHTFDGKWSTKGKLDFEEIEGLETEHSLNTTTDSLDQYQNLNKAQEITINKELANAGNTEYHRNHFFELIDSIEAAQTVTHLVVNNLNLDNRAEKGTNSKNSSSINEAIVPLIPADISPVDISNANNLMISKWTTPNQLDSNYLNILSDFTHSEGNVRVSFQVEKTQFAEKNLSFIFEIKDGKYKDRWINIRQTFPLFLYNNLNFNALNFNFEYDEELKDYVTRITLRKKMDMNAMVFKMNMYNVEDGFRKLIISY